MCLTGRCPHAVSAACALSYGFSVVLLPWLDSRQLIATPRATTPCDPRAPTPVRARVPLCATRERKKEIPHRAYPTHAALKGECVMQRAQRKRIKHRRPLFLNIFFTPRAVQRPDFLVKSAAGEAPNVNLNLVAREEVFCAKFGGRRARVSSLIAIQAVF